MGQYFDIIHTHRSSCSLAIATEIPLLVSAKHGTCMSLHEHQYIQCVVKTVYTVDSSVHGCNMILLPQYYYPLLVHMHSEGYSSWLVCLHVCVSICPFIVYPTHRVRESCDGKGLLAKKNREGLG